MKARRRVRQGLHCIGELAFKNLAVFECVEAEFLRIERRPLRSIGFDDRPDVGQSQAAYSWSGSLLGKPDCPAVTGSSERLAADPYQSADLRYK